MSWLSLLEMHLGMEWPATWCRPVSLGTPGARVNSVCSQTVMGMGALRVTPKLVPAGEPIDMGLLVPELCPDPLLTRPILDSPTPFTGEPGARLRRVFSRSVTGDSTVLLLGMSRIDTSNGGMETDVSEKCSGVLGPAPSDPGLASSHSCKLGTLTRLGARCQGIKDWLGIKFLFLSYLLLHSFILWCFVGACLVSSFWFSVLHLLPVWIQLSFHFIWAYVCPCRHGLSLPLLMCSLMFGWQLLGFFLPAIPQCPSPPASWQDAYEFAVMLQGA